LRLYFFINWYCPRIDNRTNTLFILLVFINIVVCSVSSSSGPLYISVRPWQVSASEANQSRALFVQSRTVAHLTEAINKAFGLGPFKTYFFVQQFEVVKLTTDKELQAFLDFPSRPGLPTYLLIQKPSGIAATASVDYVPSPEKSKVALRINTDFAPGTISSPQSPSPGGSRKGNTPPIPLSPVPNKKSPLPIASTPPAPRQGDRNAFISLPQGVTVATLQSSSSFSSSSSSNATPLSTSNYPKMYRAWPGTGDFFGDIIKDVAWESVKGVKYVLPPDNEIGWSGISLYSDEQALRTAYSSGNPVLYIADSESILHNHNLLLLQQPGIGSHFGLNPMHRMRLSEFEEELRQLLKKNVFQGISLLSPPPQNENLSLSSTLIQEPQKS
jgi:hypothetical protein